MHSIVSMQNGSAEPEALSELQEWTRRLEEVCKGDAGCLVVSVRSAFIDSLPVQELHAFNDFDQRNQEEMGQLSARRVQVHYWDAFSDTISEIVWRS